MSDFRDAVARMRSALAGDWELPEAPAPSRPSEELQARRRMGRDAYERSMVARGLSSRTAHVWASASWLFGDLDD